MNIHQVRASSTVSLLLLLLLLLPVILLLLVFLQLLLSRLPASILYLIIWGVDGRGLLGLVLLGYLSLAGVTGGAIPLSLSRSLFLSPSFSLPLSLSLSPSNLRPFPCQQRARPHSRGGEQTDGNGGNEESRKQIMHTSWSCRDDSPTTTSTHTPHMPQLKVMA